jgi:AcrR family transcriptional regulator
MVLDTGFLDENLIAELVKRKVINDTFRRLSTDKKNRIYNTAIKLFGEYGYDGLSIDNLCENAGISKGSFFQYFPSKTHLFEFVILIFDDYLQKWVNEVRNKETAVLAKDRILYLYQALIINSKLFKEEQKFFLYITSTMSHATVFIEGIDLSRHFLDYVREIINRGVETGEIRDDFEIDLTGYLVSVIIEGLLRRQYTEQQISRQDTQEYLISFLFDGISA